MAVGTGYGFDLDALNSAISDAEKKFKKLTTTGVNTARAIDEAFKIAANGGLKQFQDGIAGLDAALKGKGADKAIKDIGTSAVDSANKITQLVESIQGGGERFVNLMAKINDRGAYNPKNGALESVNTQLDEQRVKLKELRDLLNFYAKGEGLKAVDTAVHPKEYIEAKEREAEATMRLIEKLEQEKKELTSLARMRRELAKQQGGIDADYEPRLLEYTQGYKHRMQMESTYAKYSSKLYEDTYNEQIRSYENLWDKVEKSENSRDERIAKQKIAEYKATMSEMMALDKAMYSSQKEGKANTAEYDAIEARYKKLVDRKLALEAELDKRIADLKEKADVRNKAEEQKRAIQSGKEQQRIADKTNKEAIAKARQTEKEKLALYKATLTEMKSLDKNIYLVDTKGTDAEKGAIAETRNRYKELEAQKTALEAELGSKTTNIRKKFEAEVESETAKRLIRERELREAENKRALQEAKANAKQQAAENKRAENEKISTYRATLAELKSLDKDRYAIESKGKQAQEADKYQKILDRVRDLNAKKLALENQLGSKVNEIRRRFDTERLGEIAKRHIREIELEEKAADNAAKVSSEARRKRYQEYVTSYEGAMRTSQRASTKGSFADEEQAIVNLEAARDRLKKSDADYATKLNALNEAIKRHEKSLKDATKTDKDRADEAAKNAKKIADAQAKYDSISRRERYKAYTTSYEGAIRTSDRAKTIAQEIQAVKNLEAARAKLNKTDADYEAKLRDINIRIAEHNRNIDQATGRAKNLERQHQRNANQMMTLQSLAGSVGRALAGMFGVQAIRGYVNKLIQVRGEFELQHKSLQVLIGDIDKANELWDKTVALAVKSPFRVKDLVTYTKQLAAYRVEADKLYDTNKMLADVSAGLGVDMNRLILAFGQVKAANFLRGTELRQFSEAGVNMLEELSKRYTELEGRMVSVGEVFERVSKRMVSFSDVEAVFKTITSEGGSFYRMQEKQSETLRGMVMNLKDSIDLMFNEIGESNEGLLKGAISRVRDLVENWQSFVTVLQEVGVAFVAMKLPALAKSLGSLGTSAYVLSANIAKAGLSTAVFGKGVQRLTVGIASLTKALLKNPLFVSGAIAATILAVVHQFMRHNKEVAELNKKYDELSMRESNRLKKLQDLSEKAKEYNNTISENEEILSKSSQGTEEYANAELKLADARKSNKQLLESIKKDYPQIYDSIKKNTDGTIDLNAAIDAQNKLLVANIALNEQAKGGTFFDDVATNAKEATVALVNQYNAFEAFKNAVVSKETNLIGLREVGKISEEQFEKLNGYLKQLSSVQSASEVNTILGAMANELRGNRDAFNAIIKPIENAKNAWAGFGLAAATTWDDLKGNLDRMYPSLMHFVNTAKQFTPDTWQQEAARNISASLDAFGIVDENLLAKVRNYIESMEGIGELTWELPKPEYTEADLKDWRKVIWDAIKDVNESLGDDLGQNKVVISLQDMIELDKENIFKNLSEQVSTAAKNIDDTIEAGLIPTQERFSQAQLDAAKSTKPLIKSLSDLLAIIEKSSGGSGKDEVLEKLKNRINLIKEMNKEYEKLSKTFSKAESLAKVQKAYADTAKELGLDTSTMNFTDEGTIKSLEALLGKPEYAANKYVIELQKALDNFKVELGVEVKQEKDQDLKTQVQELFDQYDLSLELKKLNIPKDLAKSLFDVDYLDLDGLKKAVQEQEAKFIGTDMEDEYKKFLKKISDLSRKQREDEAKEFVNFLKKNLNEIQLIQDKGAYNISLADKLFGQGKITAEQYISSIRQIVEDTNKEVAKVNLDKFKDSATYIKAMGNLAAYSRDELEEMMNALQGQVGANAGNMGADEIRAYYEALERLVEQYDKIESPFQKGEINDLIEYLDLQKQLNQEKEKEAALEQRKAEINNRLNLLQAQLKSQQERGDVLGAASTQRQIKSAVGELKEVNGELVSVTSNISVISEKVANLGDGMIKSLVVAQKVVNEIANVANAATKMFDDIKSAADALGADTEGGGWAKAGYAMEMVGGVSSELTSGLSNLASGNFAGALANVVGVVTKLISGFAKIHDQNYQDIIEAQAEQVERLGKAYEKLETATESAYSIQQLQQYNEELERNVELQIASYKAMIAAEHAKKNTDEEQIEAWNEELEALTEQWEELKASLLEGVGGVSKDNYRSQTREFVDAWVSAFKETGNGLQGLKDNFREFFDNIIAEQAAMRVTEKFLEPFYESLSEALEDYELTVQESKDLREMVEKIAPDLSSALEKIWSQLGGSRGEAEGGSLSALQKGIQGITEDTAQIIEAYLNGIRGYVSEQVTHTRNIYNILKQATTSDAAAIRVRMVE